MQSVDVRVAANGRLILPASVRKAMGLQGESKVILTVDGDTARLTPIGHGISRARELYRQHATNPRSTGDFLAGRAEEATADAAGSRETNA